MRGIPSLIYSGFICLSLLFTGCFLHLDKKIIPLNDEVLVFPLAYDLVYLRSIEAIENIEGWEIEETEKERGILRARNVNFSRFDDSDRRLLTILVQRAGRKETTVRLAPESRRTIGGGIFLKKINEFVTRDL